ncbi:MAG: type II secretion system protein [Planctomycetes bacterium]|nr:type II secretion system protein [Planctomycetota bacterium]
MKRYRGITLIELIIVIGVICLLLAIVIPAVKSAKKRAERVKLEAEWRNEIIDEEYIEEDRKDRLNVSDKIRNELFRLDIKMYGET